MKSLSYYFKKAKKEGWAIGQFNFSDFSQVKGIVQAAQKLGSPIILGTSQGESEFFGLEEAVALRDVLRKKTKLPIFLNADHTKDFEHIKKAIAAGYDMVHFDGSKLPLEENMKISRQVINAARKKGIFMEGEVGRFGTDGSHVYQGTFQIKEEDLTKVEDAKWYYQKAPVDTLAVSVGTFHGIDASGHTPHLRLDRLTELRDALGIPFTLHGGSGTPEDDIKKSIKLGICKININTETRLAFSNTLRTALEKDKDQITPYKYLQEPILAVEQEIEKHIQLFGSAGKI